MPNLTPIYSLPSPLLTEQADAAAAFTALNARIEREMPALRASNNYNNESQRGGVLGGAVVVHAVTTALVVIGWVEVEVEVYMYGEAQDMTPFIAGFVSLTCNGTQLRNLRYHNQGRSAAIEKTFSGGLAIASGVTSLSTSISFTQDPASAWHYMYSTNINVRQYGAPNSG